MYDSILIPTDGKEGTVPAIEHGIRIAAETGATIHALYIIDLPQLRSSDAERNLASLVKIFEEEGRRATEDITDRAREHGVQVIEAVETGIPFRRILDYSETYAIDLVAMGTSGRGRVESYFVGSTVRKINRLSRVPVLTVRAMTTTPTEEYRNILLPTDGTLGSRRAIDECGKLAAQYNATVHVVYVIDSRIARSGALMDVMQRESEQACNDAVSRVTNAGAMSRIETLRGRPAEQLLVYTDNHDIDLIVMGTHGRTGIDRFVMGSVAEKVVRRTTKPVLTVRNLGED
ncbi:universal stress protein [Haladaptatus sp. DFWS20]|uniref:universal stress protein n=1 Tax=Haladaptatus sp. DFWS20 TaxID=3403467 RepID=UPI003EB69B7B